MQQDHQHARQRQYDPAGLRQRQPDAEQDQRPYRDEQRSGRLQQQRVQRLGMFERPVLQGVEGADPGDGRARSWCRGGCGSRAQSRIRCFQAKGRIMRNASDQRRNDSVTGGICPAARRPTMALPAQHSAVMESSSRAGWRASCRGLRKCGRKQTFSELGSWRPPGADIRAGMFARQASKTRIFTAHQWRRCIATMRADCSNSLHGPGPP